MEWMHLFCQCLACTHYFRNQVQSQLSRQFAEQTGMRLDEFVLAPPLEGSKEIYFDQQYIAYLDTDLVASDANSYPVTIAWQSPDHGRVLPADPALQSNNIIIQAWWRELPVEDLRRRYPLTRDAPWSTSPDFPFDPNNYSFEVTWEAFAWPDIWLKVETSDSAFPQSSDLVLNTLIFTREQWNKVAQTDTSMGIIHNLGTQFKAISPAAVVINIDFGSATPKALLAMLKAIQQIANLLLVRRVVCGAFQCDH